MSQSFSIRKKVFKRGGRRIISFTSKLSDNKEYECSFADTPYEIAEKAAMQAIKTAQEGLNKL